MWKWNPLDHVSLLSVSKHWYSFKLGNLISLHGSILNKVYILLGCEKPLTEAKYLQRATANKWEQIGLYSFDFLLRNWETTLDT